METQGCIRKRRAVSRRRKVWLLAIDRAREAEDRHATVRVKQRVNGCDGATEGWKTRASMQHFNILCYLDGANHVLKLLWQPANVVPKKLEKVANRSKLQPERRINAE